MLTIATAAVLGFALGYLIAWVLDPDGLFMAIARVLVGSEELEKLLRIFASDLKRKVTHGHP